MVVAVDAGRRWRTRTMSGDQRLVIAGAVAADRRRERDGLAAGGRVPEELGADPESPRTGGAGELRNLSGSLAVIRRHPAQDRPHQCTPSRTKA